MQRLDQIRKNLPCPTEREKSELISGVDFSITIEKIYQYRSYRIETIRIENNSKKTIRLKKQHLASSIDTRTISLGKTLLKEGAYTKGMRLILM